MAEDDSKTVRLVSQEGESFDVPVGVARMSELVKSMIDGTDLSYNLIAISYYSYIYHRGWTGRRRGTGDPPA